ncbi:hypothetical protein KBZ07_14380 [Cyanobium sp. BA20m-14]|uniref:hypothetical protein n=1 Tax=Cyanobium sp. BA20m-14 TaxID=2823703 RepID=UPI0020CEBCFD|nr:hypothetical protein [Cyanobium sp. BA20m-14]MCP9914562.1 hypothetical protein [Cyanobium sp. BA20m-14]
MAEPATEARISALADQLLLSLVRSHIQQLPTSALEAILNLTAQTSSIRVVELVVQEYSQRYPRLLR